MKVLDKVFLTDPVDTYYAARREHGTIVCPGLHKSRMKPASARTFGMDAAEPVADVAAWMIGEEMLYTGNLLQKKGNLLLTERR